MIPILQREQLRLSNLPKVAGPAVHPGDGSKARLAQGIEQGSLEEPSDSAEPRGASQEF